MRREEKFITVMGLVIAALSCGAGWLALPQIQPFLDEWLQNPLFWPFVGAVGSLLVLLVLLVPFIDWGAILVRLRQLSPKRRFETRYLQAVDQHLRLTPALLVISERQEQHTDLDLLQAYSQLALAADPDDPSPLAAPVQPEKHVGRLFGLRGERTPDGPIQRTLWQQVSDGVLWLAAQAALFTVALLLLTRLLWDAGSGLRLSWGSGLLALLVVLIWLALAVLVQREALPRLRQYREQRRTVSAHTGSPGAEIWQHPRLLIQGHPGSGKTTLLKHIAVVCANELLKKRHRVRLRDAYGWPVCPFPLYIPLRTLRDASVSGEQSLLSSYADTLRDVGLLGSDVARSCVPDFFKRRVARGGCIILLDAFDELRDAAARQRLGRLVSELPPGPVNNPNRIVVTSRIVGYEGQLRGKGFVHRSLAELDREQAAAFIRARYRALAQISVSVPGGSHRTRWDPDVRAERLISRLPTNPALRRLGRNPFLLSLMVSVHLKSPRELPRQRHALYQKALDLLVEEWERWKDAEFDLEPTTSEAELDRPQKLHLLYELAWTMYEGNLAADDERSHTVITGSDAEEILAHALHSIPTITAGREGAALEAHCRSEARRWLRNLGQRGGVLQELGNIRGSNDVEIQFAHQTFQEYLASQAVDHTSAEKQQRRAQRLRERWDDPRWREVFLLYAATCPDASPMVQHLQQQQQQQADLLAGAVLVEAGMVQNSALQQETQTRLTHIALTDQGASSTSALEAITILAEMPELFGQQTLLDAMFRASHHAVRVCSIELLANMEPDRPAPEPLEAHVQEAMLHLLQNETAPRLRQAAGFALARGDPRYADVLPDMVEIPAGPFLMGSSDNDKQADRDEKPQHRLELPTYWIGKTPVTNAQYRHFIEAGGYTTRRYWSWAGWVWRAKAKIVKPEYWDDAKWNGDNQPVVGISWYEAVAYCRWLSAQTGRDYRLPTEAEWEKAARGPEGLIYPWGNQAPTKELANFKQNVGRTTPVGSYPDGASPYGALDMAGNVWEWCDTRYKHNYPGRTVDWEDRIVNWLVAWSRGRVVRGGSWYSEQKFVRGAYRIFNNVPRDRSGINGVRLASHSPS